MRPPQESPKTHSGVLHSRESPSVIRSHQPSEKGVEHVRNQWRQSPISPGAQEENRETPANTRTTKPHQEIQVHNPSFRLQTTRVKYDHIYS
jgi:hypothetical protein